MKKSALLIIPAVILLLTSCGKSEKAIETYVTTENFTIYEPSSLPVSIMTDNDIQVETTTTETKNITYTVNGTDINLLVNNINVQKISLTYVPDTEKIIIADFNFDGYDDIFIPYENYGSSIIYGDYYCYILLENNFVKSSELAKIGRMLNIEEDNILSEYQNDEYTERFIEYQWENSKLNAFRKTETYTSYEDGQLHTNVYGYTDDGSEYLESSY